jgi:2,3-dihydroxyphenylpropionate 1,2-dioxygenase
MLLDERYASVDICREVRASFDRMAGFVKAFAPDIVIQFSPDHFHGFHYDNMPSFCVGTAATSFGDWNTSPGQLVVDEEISLSVLLAVREADIDAAVSYRMTVDHGFVQMWEVMFGKLQLCPVVPVFINCIADPIPFYRRARLLGEAVGRFAKGLNKKVLFAASGGLSHDPLVPKIRGATTAMRARLTGAAKWGPAEQLNRENEVRAAARDAMFGRGSSRPLNPQWDREFMRLLEAGDWAAIDKFTPQSVEHVAGSAGNEVLCWVAATAAMAASTAYEVVQRDYVPVEGWIAGMAHLAARMAQGA